jgi:Leu/Phe-tRNA-protein transferase
MRQFGAIEIPRADYLDMLNDALLHPVTFGVSLQPVEK